MGVDDAILIFQFHKGTIKTNSATTFSMFNTYFNSIKVQLKLVGWCLHHADNEFQFHKGTIKTIKSSRNR